MLQRITALLVAAHTLLASLSKIGLQLANTHLGRIE